MTQINEDIKELTPEKPPESAKPLEKEAKDMTENELAWARTICVLGYFSALGFYAMLGAVVASILLPQFHFWMFFIIFTIIGSKIDYKMKGPASKFEQKYVRLRGKPICGLMKK